MMAIRKRLFFTLSLTVFVSACSLVSACTGNPSTPTTSTLTSTLQSSSTILAKNNDYANPTYPIVNGQKKPTYMADPYVLRAEDGLFYLYCTQTEVYVDATTRLHKKGPIFVSDNAVDWKYKADVFANYTPNWGTTGAGVWAPTVCKVGEYYNFYYSLSTGGDENPGIGVARSLTPFGPYEHFGKLFTSSEIEVTNSIDPYVFEDDNQVYMVFGSYGGLITLIELSEDGLSLKGGIEQQKQTKVALAGYERLESKNYEASILLKRDGYYYLFLSTGTCCSGAKSTYNVVVARSSTLKGPYIDSEGKNMFGPSRGDYVVTPSSTGAMGVGHNALITDDQGEVWMIYHGYDTSSPTKDWRVLYLDRLYFNEETGMPMVKNRRASNGEVLPGPYLYEKEERQ